MHSLGPAVSLVALVTTALFASPHAPQRHAGASTPPGHAVPASFVVTATDYAYSGVPAEVAAGWVTIRMVNNGHELHMLATMNVPHGFTAATLIDSLLHNRHIPDDMREWGGPNAVAPGDTGSVTMYLPPGQYMLGCFVQSADKKTHFSKGMIGVLHVTATSAKVAPPSSTHLVTLSSYAIGTSGPRLRAGVDTLRISNVAKERHDLVALKVAPGHSVADVLAWFTDPPTGATAATAVAGTTALHPGEDAYITGNFTPGTYVLACWMYKDGKPHAQIGMNHVFTVVAS